MAKPGGKFKVNRRRGRKHNWTNNHSSSKRMLDMGRRKSFLYDLDELLEDSDNDKNKNVFKANIISKASKNGIDEAREYVDELDDEELEKGVRADVKKLLRRYSTKR